MRTKWNTRWRARLPAKPRHAFNKFVYPAQPGSNRPGLGSSATSYLSTMARSIKRETFPFKRSFSIIKCFPSPPKSTSRKLHASILSSSFFFVFQLVEPGRRENLLPYPTVTPFFSPLCATSAFLMPPTYHQRTVAQRSHRNLFASGYTTPHRGQQSSGPSWKIDQKRSDRARARFFLRDPTSPLLRPLVPFVPSTRPASTPFFRGTFLFRQFLLYPEDVSPSLPRMSPTSSSGILEEGRKRRHFHPRYSTISDIENHRDGSRNRLWLGNATLSDLYRAPYISYVLSVHGVR